MVNKSPRTTNIYYPLKGTLGRKYLSKKLFCKPHMENLSTWVKSTLQNSQLTNSSDYSTPVLKRDKNNCYDGDTSLPLMLLLLKKHYSRKAYAANSKKVLQYNSLAKSICIII